MWWRFAGDEGSHIGFNSCSPHRESAKYHPQPAEGYLVLTGLKGKVVLCNLCETNEIFDRVRGFKLLCLTGDVKSQGAVLSDGFFCMCI